MKTFPPFRLDSVNQCLWRGEARISLAPKAFAVLRYLVDHADRLVSQNELLEALWAETYVQPEVLRKYILEIRKVLEDPPKNPRFVATFPKRGYQFIAPVTEAGSNHTDRELTGRLVGRGPALAELNRFLDAAARGQRQVIFVTGEAGIGKTTLADAFQLQGARKAGVRIARGQCMEGFGGKEAYYPVLDAFGQLMHGAAGEAVVETLAAHAPTWLIQFPGAVKPERREALQRETLGATRERMVREICEALETLAAEQPLILILEDLQWADESTLDLISALARRRGAAQVMLLATYRPVEVILSGSPLKLLKQDLLIHRLCRAINLERLTVPEVEEYLATEFSNSGLPRLLSGIIHRHSDGNPLFMVAMVEQLVEKGFIGKESGRWLVSVPMDRLDPGVPETLQQMLEVQFEQLAAPEQRLLRAASVAGRRFSEWAVTAMLDGDTSQVEEQCEALATRNQFIRRGGVQEATDGSAYAQYEFRHALYREVLYRQLPATHRRQFHLRLAIRMEGLHTPDDPAPASGLASHFEEGRDYERAVRYLILAAGNAARRYAHADSVQVLRHALELLPHLAETARRDLEIQILERISDALYAQGEMVQSAEIDQKVVELAAQAGFKASQVNALTRLARALAFLDPDRCTAVCERALDVSRTHDDPLLEARTEMLAACWRIITNGWRKEDAEICEAARAKIRSLSDEVPAYYEILYAHVQCTQGDYEEAYRTAMAGIPKSIENDSLVVYLSAHSSLVQALLHLGRWGELLRVIGTALDVVKKNGNAPWLGIFQANLARLHFDAHDLAGARRIAEDLMRTHTEKPAGQVRTMALLTAGYASLESGSQDQAWQYFTSICDRELRPRFFLDWYWRMYGRLGLSRAWLAKGDSVRAGQESDAFHQAALSSGDPAVKALAWDLQASVAIVEQDWDRARDSLNQALAILETVKIPSVGWRVHTSACALHERTGDIEAAARHRARAAAIILELASSFQDGEPLRDSLLARLPSSAGSLATEG